jgi:hypothetical protein
MMYHRARNRVTAAESRKRSKSEALLLKDEVQRLGADLKGKNDVLQEFKDKLEMYEQGTSKADIEKFIAQRRAISAAAAVAATAPEAAVIAAAAGRAAAAMAPAVADIAGLVAVAQAQAEAPSLEQGQGQGPGQGQPIVGDIAEL